VFFYQGFLSQWYPSVFREGELKFENCEQYMMYHKAQLFGDEKRAKLIMKNGEPKRVKRLGRQVEGFDEKIWTEHREVIVYRGNLLKFSQVPELKALLLVYENPIFVEASPTDRIWGIGFSTAKAMDNIKFWGQNLLGKAITKVYYELKK
jgi:ribA/ribD-fused uncharacterized protein